MVDIQQIQRFLQANDLDDDVVMEPVTAAMMKNVWYEDHMTALSFEDHPTFPAFTRTGDSFIIDFMSLAPHQNSAPLV